MQMNKREFLVGTTFLGVASLAGAPSVRAAQGSGARTASVFNVVDFGAKGDGKTPDSEAIQKALDAAGAVGGTVYLPVGRHPCHDLKVAPHTTVLAEPQRRDKIWEHTVPHNHQDVLRYAFLRAFRPASQQARTDD
jgi:hypothetical protein